ncbi:MAG: hypothetical protein K2O10_01800, partial [Muribaculaceae bacterium]|nr:hypothetical protein [Muribaculaceae bacterium]
HVGTAALSADMAVLPLLRGEILGRRLCASGAVVDIGTPDSAMYMTTRLKMAEIDDASVRLSSQQIEVGRLRGAGARVRMLMRPDTVAPEVKTDTVPVRWHIALGQADLSDVDFGMQMQPLIDTLACVVPRASVRGAMVDMATNRIAVDDIAIDSVDARYIYFPADYAASYPLKAAEPADTAASLPWTVTARSLSLTNSRALYALKGYSPPTAAFDPQYIAASEIDIAVDSFRNRGQEITVPIRRISARERCGVPLSLTGWFGMDSTAMTARNILLSTPTSAVKLDGSMGIAPAGSTLTLMQLPVELRLNARISNDDMRRLVPYPSTAIVRQLPAASPLDADVDLAGVASQRVELRRCLVRIPGYVEVTAQGCVDNMLGGLDRMTADISLTGRMRNGNFLKPMFLDAKTGKEINLPPLSVSGNVTARNGVVSGDVQARTAGGALALDASWNNRSQGYDLTLDASSFPLQSIMPGLEMSDIDADVTAVGHGLDPFSPETDMKARIGLRHMVYKGQSLDNIVADATLAGGVADLKVTSANKAVDLTVAATGNLAGSELVWNFDGDIRNLDLKALGMSPTVSEGSVKLTGDARLDFVRPPFAPAKGESQADVLALLRCVQASVDVSSLYWRMPDMTVNGNDVMLRLDADTAVTMARLDNHDLSASFTAYDSPAGLLPRLSQTAAVVGQQIKARGIKADTLHTTLPRFNLDFKAGRDNILANYLLDLDMKFDSVSFMAANDSILTARGNVVSLQVGKTTIDSVALTMHQRRDYLVYDITVDNKPGTMDQFAWINGRGYLGPENFALAVKQKNIGGDTGFSFGTLINMPDSSTVLLRFVPYHPVIGYKDWQINRDNFIKYNMASRHLDANIDLRNDVSTLQILTEHHQGDSAQDDLVVRLKDIELADWATLTPFAPPVKGNLSADVRLGIQGADINGRGTLGLAGLTYAGQPVGDFDMGLDVTTNTSGVIKATTSLKVNGQEAITASGVLNDSTASNPFMLDCRVIRFPLSVANAFLPQGTARMAGVLNGEMEVTGQMSSPRFNGWLAFDSASVTPAMLGTALAFPSDRIPVDDNVVRFNNFAIKAVNDNPLRINGWVNMQDMSVMKLDLDIKANNMQLVGGKRQRGADVYGKAFVDVDARVKGSTRFMSVDASLALLAGSNVTYVIPTLT